MILRPILSPQLRPILCLLLPNRNLKPTIKINKHKFQISLDVHQFEKNEIRVKARSEHVIIQGKQERKTVDGYVIRRFMKKIRLPPGCDPENMTSKLSEEGILTITAEREYCEENLPCETIIHVKYGGPKDEDDSESFIKIEGPFTVQDQCGKYKDPPKDKRFTIKAEESIDSKDDKKS